MYPPFAFGALAMVWVGIYWRTLVLRRRVIETMKRRTPLLYGTTEERMKSFRLVDRLFASSERVSAQCEHEALLMRAGSILDGEIQSVQRRYRASIVLLFAWTIVFVGAMLGTAWLLSAGPQRSP